MNIETLSDKIRTLASLKEQKKRLNEMTKDVQAELDQQEREITTAMLDMADTAGLTNVDDFAVSVDGRRYSVVSKPYYSIAAEKRDEAFQALRSLGLGDLVVERVDDRALTRALIELAEDAGGELPEQYSDIPMRKYEDDDLRQEGGLIMSELMVQNQDFIHIRTRDGKPLVSGRELHEWLEVKERYNDWFPRMCGYGFDEGHDYWIDDSFTENSVKPQGGRPATDHELSIAMGKELSMLQRTDRGKQARRYFLRIEDAWNRPEVVMARALQMAEDTLAETTNNLNELRIEHSAITVQNQIMAPKAEYFDELVNRNLLTNFRETATALRVGQKAFISFLTDHGFLYRDKKNKLMPYAGKNDGLFEVKECFNDKTDWTGVQTLVTPKGRETFRLLLQGLTF